MIKLGSPMAMFSSTIALSLLMFLVIQDQRHAWPFSRHHSLGASQTAQTHGPRPDVSRKDAAARAPIEVPEQQMEALGVRFEPVQVQPIDDPVRAVATVVADESRISHVHARIAGWVEELYVSTTGQAVRAGQPLAAIFSQELYSSQQEYLAALRRADSGPASAVLEAARTRLELLGVSRAQIERLEQTRQAQRLVTITAPRSGIVLNRGVSAGTSVDPSTVLVTLADLSYVWVIAEVAEGEAAQVRPGSVASVSFPMTQAEPFSAKVEFIYPTLTERTRTVRVRLSLNNKTGALRPGMYGSAEFKVAAREALTVARDAVVDTGTSQHVFVHTADNIIEPRTVKIGARLSDRIEVTQGLSTGDHVVTAGVFLIDSESRLRASGATGHAGHGGEAQVERADTQANNNMPAHEH
ncbi:MAG TPA: efflux RND transporter periplasmic adaptor subunit [Steroidobacter sp.]|uniref:efflux RND transporter periplasmic adaptor subunit n=1 Tax=Steroidobacter sp. TaxID=1978227 RepID=UPI002EDB19DF